MLSSLYSRRTAVICIVVAVSLLLIQIWVAHITTTSGEKLKEIDNLQKILKSENQLLENEISKFSSINHIATEAASLGLDVPKNIQYIK